MRWRHEISHETNETINHLVRKSHTCEPAFKKGRHIRTNQLWCALAGVYSELRETQERLAQAEEELLTVKNSLRRTGEYLTQPE